MIHSSSAESTPDFAAYVEVTAHLLNLPIPDDLKDGVVDQFAQIWQIAQPVLEFPLTEDIAPAPVFEP